MASTREAWRRLVLFVPSGIDTINAVGHNTQPWLILSRTTQEVSALARPTSVLSNMPYPLIAVLYPLIKPALGKWVVGHLATTLAHAPAHAVATFAHQVGTNAVVAAASAPTATAAISMLYKSGKDGKKLADKVMAIQSKEELRSLMRRGRLSQEEKVEALVLAITIALFEEILSKERKKRVSGSGYKTKVTHLEPCNVSGCTRLSGKPCHDFALYDDRRQICYCLHGKNNHQPITDYQLTESSTLEYILATVAGDIYKGFGHRFSDGSPKEHLQEIRPCTSCSCGDFDLEKKGLFSAARCYCGHKDREHRMFHMFSNMVPSDYSWIVGIAVANVIEESNLESVLS
jgi:hypothetical protein